MRAVQDIYFDITGQLLYFDAPEGRPSSVTSVSVLPWDMSDEQTAESATGAGSVETGPNTTLDGDAGSSAADPRLIPLTATTDVALERTYRVTAASGAFEWAEIESIGSGVSATAKHPLHNIYASGATFQSTRIQATVDSTWVADSANITTDDVGPNPMYRVRWVYVVGGVTYVADSYFNLVRYAGRCGVLPQDIEAMHPGWLDRLPTDHRNDQGRRLISDAYRGVKIDLHQIDMAASSLAESEIVDELVRYKAIELGESARFIAGGVDADRVQFATQRYTARLDSLLRIVARVPFRDETGAATPVIAVGLTRR
jgi:hypothetical protein